MKNSIKDVITKFYKTHINSLNKKSLYKLNQKKSY